MLAYIVTNTITGRRYVGITSKTAKRRWARHIETAAKPRGGCTALGAAILKYGPAAFVVEAVACARTIEDLKAVERILILQEGTLAPAGYNLTSGGDGGFNPAPETRARLRAAMRARPPRDPAWCARIALAKRGTRLSAEHRAVISARQKGRPLPEAMRGGRRGPENGMFNKNHSPETRAKMSASRTGKRQSEATRAKRIATLTGREFTEEHRAKLSAAAKARSKAETAAHLRKFSEAMRGRPGKLHTSEARAKMSAAQRARWERAKS